MWIFIREHSGNIHLFKFEDVSRDEDHYYFNEASEGDYEFERSDIDVIRFHRKLEEVIGEICV